MMDQASGHMCSLRTTSARHWRLAFGAVSLLPSWPTTPWPSQSLLLAFRRWAWPTSKLSRLLPSSQNLTCSIHLHTGAVVHIIRLLSYQGEAGAAVSGGVQDGSGAASTATAWGSTPTSASEDTRIPASGGSGVLNRAASSSLPTEQGDWPVNDAAAQMQARMQHQQGNGQQMPAPQMGPYSGPGSMPFFGTFLPDKTSINALLMQALLKPKDEPHKLCGH